METLEINLKPDLKYFVGVCDTKYALMTANPKLVPGKLFHLSKPGLVLVYFDVSTYWDCNELFHDQVY